LVLLGAVRRFHRLASKRVVWSEMGRYQLSGRDDERDTLDRLWRRRPMQDRVLPETDADSSSHRGHSRDMESRASLPQARQLGLRKWPPSRSQAVLGTGDLAQVHSTARARTRIEKRIGWHTLGTRIQLCSEAWARLQGDARTVASLLPAINAGRLHSGDYAGQACRSRRPSLVFSPKRIRIGDVPWTTGGRCAAGVELGPIAQEKGVQKGHRKVSFLHPF
jgi:hypothetical protein